MEERERDLILSPNEYAYVLDKTKGLISCVTGPFKMSLSNSDALVAFNKETKRFEEVLYNNAIFTFTSAPENWYVVLKNPAKGDTHPTHGKSNDLPELEIGKKVNIPGNISFALYPGQMAKVIQGHTLRSNQYLVAQVYDADVLDKVDVVDDDGEPTGKKRNLYSNGQLIIIKGTDESFYIPPTGVEVVPIEGTEEYVRDAVTLRKLEYCILNNESGEKKYVCGANVVFPEPDETFEVNKTTGGYIFKAIELTENSGIYVKVNTDYYETVGNDIVNVDPDDEEVVVEKGKSVLHKAGEELFITGKDQMIYFPRTEHTIIDYDGRIVHHATAIPKGEGRYVMNRNTGEIRTIIGPAMYLPDPREEVFVNRKLTEKECNLWYPGNKEVLNYNLGVSPNTNISYDALAKAMRSFDKMASEPIVTTDVFSRGTTYTKPRTITFDNKFDGAVQINVWTGYAVNVVSKDGKRRVVVGPQTCILNYDETLEEIVEYTENGINHTVYLNVSDSIVSDCFAVQTKDFVDLDLAINYNIRFDEKHQANWFNVKNYDELLATKEKSIIKREIKNYSIEEFCNHATEIIRNAVLNSKDSTCSFAENGMVIYDVDIDGISFADEGVSNLFNNHQANILQKTFELSTAQKESEMAAELAKAEKIKDDLKYENTIHSIELKESIGKTAQAVSATLIGLQNANKKAIKQAENDLLKITSEIQKTNLAINKAAEEQELLFKQKNDELVLNRQNVYAENAKKIIGAISPDLIASMTSTANADLLSVVAAAMGPYAVARGESVADVTNKLLRGTSLEGMLGEVLKKIERVPVETVIVDDSDGKVIEESSPVVSKPRKRTTKKAE